MTTNANSKLNISELDFDKIKQNLITYLQNQSEWTDYNFQGSGLSVLLDVLSYNTHYNGYYANMLINEMFLDSAVKRGSVISRAKELGYNFKTSTASVALVNVLVNVGSDTPTSLVLPRGTIFRSMTPSGLAVNFVTTESSICRQVSGQYIFHSVPLTEGTMVQNSFVLDSVNNPRSVFEIPNADVDSSTMKVYVRSSINSVQEDLYTLANTAYNLSSLSKVYFLQENYLGKFEIQFGDNILGKALENGNVVRIEYIVSQKAIGNGCAAFLLDTFGGYTTLVQTTSVSLGGAEKESTDTIRSLAPKTWAAQNRLVTAKDYYTWAMSNVPAIQSVSVWGGEDNDPPYYGKVFIAIKPQDGLVYSTDEKAALVTKYFKGNSVVTITPVIIDPSYIFVTVGTEIKYNPDLLTISPDALKTLCANSINNWFNIDMQQFDTQFYFSKFIRMIDDIDVSIISNQTEIKLQRRINFIENQTSTISANFLNPIKHSSLTSNYFQILYNNNYYIVYATDTLTDPIANTGIISLLNSVDGSIILSNAGSIDYSKGKLNFLPIYVSNTYDLYSQLRFNVVSTSADISVIRDTILTLDDSGLDSTKNQFHGLVINMTPTR